jgi:hypothetical protein
MVALPPGPGFFCLSFLSPDDRLTYLALHQQLGSPETRFQRHRRLSLAREQMNTIQAFCARGWDDDWTRYLACGVCWLSPTRVAIHVRQFAFTIGKSKSSVNGVMARLNFVANPARGPDAHELMEHIPCLRRRPGELKHWEIRERVECIGPAVVCPPPAGPDAQPNGDVQEAGGWSPDDNLYDPGDFFPDGSSAYSDHL